MIKLIGSIAVISAGSGWGVVKSRELSKRVEFLSETENALLILQNEITVSGRVLSDIFGKCGNRIFEKAAKYIYENGTSDGFKRAVKEEKLPVQEEDALLHFADGLTAQDREGQLENIALCAGRISRIRKEAEERRAKLGRLYAATGFLGSLAVVLIFI